MVITGNQWAAHSWNQAFRGRYASIAVVVLLHLGMIYTLLIALGIQPSPLTIQDTRIVETVPVAPPPEQPTLVPDPGFPVPTLRVTVPDVQPTVTYAPDAPTATAIPESSKVQPARATPAVAPAPARVAPRIDLARSIKPAYPPLSRRLNEEGSVTIRVLVGAAGNVVDATVETSSGYTRLDAAALDGVRHGYRFTPATEGGRPVEMWQRIVVSFHLSDRD